VTGVSVFWVDAGIDTGPILLQKRAEVGPDATAGTLYYETLVPLGVETVLESVELIAAGKAPRLDQDESLATYDPLCRDEHAAIDWAHSVDAVYNLIRGCDPQPGAYTTFGGDKLRLYDCRKEQTDQAVPGVVTDVVNGLEIAARGGAIRAKRVRWGTDKVAASDFAAHHGVTAGTRLG
jgi:methionyl-tRNA formyltransferase